MESWLAALPLLLSIAFFAGFASRLLRIWKGLRDPEALSKALASHLESTLSERGLDPEGAEQLRIRLREEIAKQAGRTDLLRAIVVEPGLEPAGALKATPPSDRASTPLSLETARTPAPIRAEQGSALRFALCLGAIVIGLWIYYSLP